MPDARMTAPAFWGAKAAEYDAYIRRVVPRYEEMVARLLDYLPASPARVLELGCGTGTVSLALLERMPDAALTVIDAAPEMIEATRARVARRGAAAIERVRFVVARFEDVELEPESYDAVVASISLHHVREPAPIYDILRTALARGGALRIADGYLGATPALHALHMARWEAFWREPGNLEEEEIAPTRLHVHEHDHYYALTEHFRLLTDAGFVGCDCVWRDGLFAILSADVV